MKIIKVTNIAFISGSIFLVSCCSEDTEGIRYEWIDMSGKTHVEYVDPNDVKDYQESSSLYYEEELDFNTITE